MHNLRLLIALASLAVYLGLAVQGIRAVLRGEGGAWRSRLRATFALGPGEILRHTYRGLILGVIGLLVVLASLVANGRYLEYTAAPTCGPTNSIDCRDLRPLQVSGVHVEHARSGDETVIDFGGGIGQAYFYVDDVSPASLTVGGTLTAEIWRGQVTAVVIDGTRHVSFASQSDAWIGMVAGAAVFFLGLMWLGIDLAVASMDPDLEKIHDWFAEPSKRRRALYVLLPLFGAALVSLGFAYVALLAGAVPTANTLANVYLAGGVLVLPVLVVVFIVWFVRAYLNVGALGLRIRHSEWFVAAALLLPPLSLYMPYRLARDVVTKTQAPVTPAMLRTWWLCAVGWLALTIVGLTIGSPDPTDTRPIALLSDALLAASVVVGLIAVVLSVRLIRAVDTTELILARQLGRA